MNSDENNIFLPNCLLDKDNKLILYAKEKANWTVIAKMFFDNLNLLDIALNYSKYKWIHDYRWQKFVPKNKVFLKDLKNKDYLKIKFMRCPYNRAVSSFIHIMKYSLIKDKKVDTFEKFLDFLNNNNHLTYHPKCNINSHATTQVFYNEKRNYWDEIIRCENLETEIKRINKKYNLHLNCNFNSYHWNKPKVKKCNEKYVGSIEFSKELCNNNYINFYNEKTKALVEKLYKEDIEYLNYTFDEFIQRNR